MFNEIGINAKKASQVIARLSTDEKNTVLNDMSQELIKNKDSILSSNKLDLENSKEHDLSTALIDRLTLNEERILGMSNGLQKIIPLSDPVGEITKEWTSEDGLLISKVRNPFGVIGVIYEARPNVTSDVSGLCLKSGNAVILRGSSYCLDSNKAILQALQNALHKNNLDKKKVESYLLESLNEFRADYGKSPVKESEWLSRMSQVYSKKLIKSFKHDYNQPAAENIAHYSVTLFSHITEEDGDINKIIADAYFDLYIASQGHTEMLLSDHQYFGFGITFGDTGEFWGVVRSCSSLKKLNAYKKTTY